METAELIDLNCTDLGGQVKTTPVKNCNNPFDEAEANAGLPADIFDMISPQRNTKQIGSPHSSKCQVSSTNMVNLCNSPGYGKSSALNYALLNHRQLTAKRLPFFSKSPNRGRIASDPGLLKTKQTHDILEKLRTSSFDKGLSLNFFDSPRNSPRSSKNSSILNFSQMNDSLDDLNSVRLNLVDSEIDTDPDIDEMVIKFPAIAIEEKVVERGVEVQNASQKLIDIVSLSPVSVKRENTPCDPERQEQLRQVLHNIKEKNEEEENLKFFNHLESEVVSFITKNDVKFETEARTTLKKLIDLLAGKVDVCPIDKVDIDMSCVREETFEIKRNQPEVSSSRRQSLKPTIVTRSRRSMSENRRSSESFNTSRLEDKHKLNVSITTPKSALRRRNSVTFANVKENIPPEFPVKERPRRSYMPNTPNTKLKNFAAATANQPPMVNKLKFKKPASIEKVGPIRAVSMGTVASSSENMMPKKVVAHRQSLNPQVLQKPFISSTPIQSAKLPTAITALGTPQLTPLKSKLMSTPSKIVTPSRLALPTRLATPSRLVTPTQSRLARRNSLGQYNSPN